jgi:hypothetical protein
MGGWHAPTLLIKGMKWCGSFGLKANVVGY